MPLNNAKLGPILISGRRIGEGEPCYLIAEVGTTCLGDLDKALKLVEAGAAAGMDAVKFQLIDPTQLSDKSVKYTYRAGGKTYSDNMFEMFSRITFTEDEWRGIAGACAAAGVHFFATVDFLAGVDLLEQIGVPAHKAGAWDCSYRPLIERMGATGKPMFIDLGPTTEEEFRDLSRWYLDAGGTAVLPLHDYHTQIDAEMNLCAVPYLAETYGWPAGYSAPGRDDDLDFAALALGAAYIEKRLILSRSERAFHADESLEPDELKTWVGRLRHVERALGRKAIVPSRADSDQKKDHYRSICTLCDMRAGEVFAPENLGGKRPGSGLPTARLDQFWGRQAARDLRADTLITEEDAR